MLARALEIVAEGLHVPVSAEDARSAATSDGGDLDAWAERAASAARTVGLHVHADPRPPEPAPQLGPAFTRIEPGVWLVVRGSRRRRVRVTRLDDRGESSAWMTARQLRALGEVQPWLHVRPALVLEPLATRRNPKFVGHPWLRLRAFLGLQARELGIILAYAITIGALTLATPIAVQALVNTVTFGAVLQPLFVLSLLLFAVLSFSATLAVFEAYVVEVLQRRIFVRITEDFGRRLPRLASTVLDRHHGPELVNRFFDVLTLQKTLSSLLLDGLALVLQMAIGMTLLAFYHPALLALDVVLVVLLVAVLLAGRGAVAAGLQESSAKYRVAAWLEDVIRVPHLFRGTTAQRHASERAEMLCRDYLVARKRHFRILLRQIVGGVGLQVLAMVALLGVGGWLVIARQLTLGQLVAAELVVAAMGYGFAKLGHTLEKVYDLDVGVLKIAGVVDLAVERLGGERLPHGGPASVTLRDAACDRGGPVLVTGANLHVAASERILLDGPPGSGKSTLLDVLGGMRPPAAGSVQIAGVDLRRADLGSVRDGVALVRGAAFVEGSILENLHVGRSTRLPEPEVRDLLRLLELEAVIDRLPSGLETMLLPCGAPLSETEARRLALVRALAGRPRLLLIDRGLDRLGLPEARHAELLVAVLGPDAPWTAVVVTDEPEVAAACHRVARIEGARLEVLA